MDITMLKEYLGDELYARAEEKLGGVGDLQVIAAHDGSWLPRARLDQEIAKRRELQGTVESLTGALDEARKQSEESGALRAEVERLGRELESHDRRARLREALTRAQARDVDLLERLMAGETGDIDEHIATLRRQSPYLFEGAAAARAGFGGGRGADARGGHDDVNGAIRAAAGKY